MTSHSLRTRIHELNARLDAILAFGQPEKDENPDSAMNQVKRGVLGAGAIYGANVLGRKAWNHPGLRAYAAKAIAKIASVPKA